MVRAPARRPPLLPAATPDPARAWIDRPRTHLVLLRHGSEAADARVLVLVAGPAPALLELRPTARGLEPRPRLPLPAAYQAFVR